MRSIHSILLVAFVVALASGVFAQTSTTSLRGTVLDPSGAVVPGAQITLNNEATGFQVAKVTNPNGEYNFLQIPPGKYTVTVNQSGFAPQTKVAELLVNQPATVNFTLSVNASAITVDVSSATETLNTTDATIGNAVNNSTIVALPMEGRNVPDLLSLQPGVLYLSRQVNQDRDSRSGAVSGARSDQSNITLDGVDDNDQRQGYAFNGVLRSTLDSVEEFRVTTTDSNADNGRSSGAQVTLVTKSGTNSFHGSLYEYNRNTATTANDWFNKQAELSSGLPNKPGELIRNTFGGSLGGPIKRDKLFFFVNYERQPTRENKQETLTVPTASFRQGNLQYVDVDGNTDTLTPSQIASMDPKCSGNGTCPWGPGVDPNSLATLQAYPMPNGSNSGDGLNTASFTWSAPNPTTLNTYIAKIDYVQNDRSRFFVRGNLMGDHTDDPPQFPGGSPSDVQTNTSKGIAVGHTWTISNNLINNLRYGYIRQQLGVTGAGNASFSDFAGISPLTPENRSTLLVVPVHTLVDDLAWVKGTHTLQFGANWRLIHNNSVSNSVSFNSAASGAGNISLAAIAGTGQSFDPEAFGFPAVSDTFSSSYDNAVTAIAGLLATINVQNTYQVAADGTQATLLPTGTLIPRSFKSNEGEFYAQDSWRIKPNLTLTYGARYTLLQPPYEVHGQQVAPTIDLNQWFINRGLAAAKGMGDQPEFSFAPSGQSRGGKPYWNMNWGNFAPRLAVAYSPGFNEGFLRSLFGGPGQTSIRAGAGVYYDHFGEGIVDGFSQFGSFGLTSTQAAPSNILTPDDAPRYLSRTTVPSNILTPAPTSVSYPATPPDDPLTNGFTFNSDGIDDRIKTPYSVATDLSIQRQLPRGFTFEAAYVGRFGRNLLQQLDIAEPTDLVDPASGMDYFTAARQMSQFALANGENPNVTIAPIPFFEDLFPTAAAGGQTATQNIYSGFWFNRPGREVGAPFRLSLLCTHLANGGVTAPCVNQQGPPFWDPQYSSLLSWWSLGVSNYNAAQFTLRHAMSHGLQLDFSYTLSKSMDYGSDTERTNPQGPTSSISNLSGTTGYIGDSWKPGLNYAPSDFDTRHLITTDWVYLIPFGRGQAFGSQSSGVVNAIFGGWQFSGLARWTSALPFSVLDNTGFTNNFFFESNMVQTGKVNSGLFFTPGGAPEAFQDPGALEAGIFTTLTPLRFPYAGEAGSRNNFRGQGYFGIDSSLTKTWNLTERQSLRFAWEVFNVTNSVRFDDNTNTSLDNGSSDGPSLGLYSKTLTAPRVQQFSLRYSF